MQTQHWYILGIFLCGFTSANFGQKGQLYPRGDVFPMVLYDVAPSEFARARAAGFNTVHIYSSTQSLAEAQSYLEQAAKHGLFVMQNMPSANSPANAAFWNGFVNGVKGSANLAWWYLPEEESAAHQSPIAAIVRGNDERPTASYLPWDAEQTLREYQSFLEISTKGSYPNYYGEPRANCASWVESHSKVFQMVAPTLEAFGDLPTPREARYDAYASIIAGAKGLCWYAYAYIKNDTTFWSGLKRITYELAGEANPDPIGKVVLSANTTNRVSYGILSGPTHSPTTYGKSYPSIIVLEKEHNGTTYLLAVNNAQVYPGRAPYSDATVMVAFAVPGDVTRATVLFEDGRKLEMSNTVFTDSFDALDVHVYKLETAVGDTTAPASPNGVHVERP